ncbi:MAG: suppressor of fused domain protein [Coriobacteriia bacterium]
MDRKAVTASGRVAAKAIHDAIGGKPEVRRYRDDSEMWYVDVAIFADRPGEDLTTYSTIGVHAYPNAVDGRDIPTELSIVAATSATSVPNMLVEAAFLIMKDKWICAPGVVFPNLVAEYALSRTMRHLLWCPPFPWEQLGSVDLGEGLRAHWLLAVPISDAERDFLFDHGYLELERLFEEKEILHYDLNRKSAV